MKRSATAFAVVGVLLLIALVLPYTDSYGFTRKGLPLGYYKTIDTHGLCVGFLDETIDVNDGGGCGKRKFPLNYERLAADLAIVGVIFVAFLYILFRHSDKLRNKAIYGLVGGSIATDTLFWFSSQNSSLFINDLGLEDRTINYPLALLLAISLVFLIAVVVYLIRSVFKHLSGTELIKRLVPCLIAIAIFFGYCWLIIAGES